MTNRTKINLIALCLGFVIGYLIIGPLTREASASNSTKVYENKIYNQFGRGWLGREMVCIARRESRLNPKAINWSDRHPTDQGTFRGSFGLFQIGALHSQHTRGVAYRITNGNKFRLLDPNVNIQAAWKLYMAGKRQGYSGLAPWGGGC